MSEFAAVDTSGVSVSIETLYAQTADVARRKRFGQFFTPPLVADLMADWILEHSPLLLLDPAFGTGVLARALFNRGGDHHLTAYEIDSKILSYSDLHSTRRVRILNTDFLEADFESTFDGIIMNPPYIRHREIDGYEAVRAQLSIKSGFSIPKSANLYIYFAVKALLQLKLGGRAAFLMPTEWMNSNFGLNFKRFLIEKKLIKELVIFSGCSNIFEGALTTASVLFLEKDHD